ncbi:MAG: hypothetical protein Q7R43_00250 [Candidatus Daviesbacteria bacterium]|nr:hypothetical protein [Candidatus Daviesbacteria bacterium]
MTQRINFYQIFKINPDGSIEPLRLVRIGGVQMGPGVRFGKGVSFGGIDLSQFIGRDFEVEDQSGVYVIKGIF